MPTTRCCPAGLVFNEAGQYCDWPANVAPNNHCWEEKCHKDPIVYPNPCPGAKLCYCFTGYCESTTDYSVHRAVAEEQPPSDVSQFPYGPGARFDGQKDFYSVPFFSNQWVRNGPTELLTIIVFTPNSGRRPIQGLFGNGGCGEEYTLGCKIIGIYSKFLYCTVNDVNVYTDLQVGFFLFSIE